MSVCEVLTWVRVCESFFTAISGDQEISKVLQFHRGDMVVYPGNASGR